jgi:hypothetical protein
MSYESLTRAETLQDVLLQLCGVKLYLGCLKSRILSKFPGLGALHRMLAGELTAISCELGKRLRANNLWGTTVRLNSGFRVIRFVVKR